ncbi:PilW family protein [Fontivita pretiosa]|uniref:PilW family protein n=1 Tax=Fontivita pretiosa TaxID=2989684 RepID=UPI003D1752AA
MSPLLRRSRITPARRRRRGMGLIELLVALAISAALLTSVAVAIDASFKAYAANQTNAQLMQRARLAMNRITTYIRATNQHLPDDNTAQDQFESGLVTQASAIRMMLDETNGVIFRQSGQQLQMVPFTISGSVLSEGTPHVLLEGVGSGDFTIRFEPQRSTQSAKVGGRYDQLKRASISLTIRPTAKTTVTGESTSGEAITLSTSVMPRKNIW